jgi:putative peptidoglycan lipid II flippase
LCQGWSRAGGSDDSEPRKCREDSSLASSLIKAVASVGGNTLLSRILGFVRDLVVARVFGADAATDAFFVAFKVPNLLRRLFGEGAFAAAFVPVLAEFRLRRSFEELKLLVDRVAGTLGLVLFLVTVLGTAASPALIGLFGAGFAIRGDHATFWLASAMLSLTFSYLLFISLTALSGGILNAHDRFAVPAFTPVLLNVSLIACALWLAPHLAEPITALAWGVLVAGFLQLGFQLPFLGRLGLIPRPRIAPRDPGVRRILGLMGPALFGVSVTQINLMINTLFASFLTGGSISWLYYSDRLMEFPLGILAVALGTVILPHLSHRHAESDPGAFSAALDWGLRWLVLLGLPAALALLVLAGPLMATLFQSGEFDALDVTMAQRSLWAYSLGLVGLMGVKVLAPGFYARQDTRTPVRFGVIAVIFNLGLSLVLVGPLAHAGLALATSLSACLNAALLLRGLLRAGAYRPESGWRALLLRTALALVFMAAVLLWVSGDLASWLGWTRSQRIWRLGGTIALGGLSYFAALFVVGVRPAAFWPSGGESVESAGRLP